MIKFFTRLGVAFSLCLFLLQKANASHYVGSDITYNCLGGNQYEIVFSFYRDCTGISVDNPVSVTVTSSCGTQTVALTLDNIAGVEVSQLCANATSTCNGGSYQGVQVYTFRGVVTLQPGCGTYTFTYALNARNPSTNIQNATSQGYMVRATLNSDALIGGNCQSAPSFTSLPVPYVCTGQLVNYSAGTVETDGDSLVYQLVAPLNQTGGNIPYVAPFSPTNPMPTASGFGFDPQTGQMTFVPTQQGVYVVNVLVSEYRNGVLVGTTIRDMQFVVINCANTPPIVNDVLTLANVTGAEVIDGNSLGVCPGTTVSFTILGYDPDGQPITVTSNIAASVPGATLTTTQIGGPDSVQVTFTWTPSGLDTGFRYFTVEFRDNACPIPGVQLYTYDITVLAGTTAGPDRAYCTGGGPVLVTATGGNAFTWTPTTGIVSQNGNGSQVYFAPSTTTTYIVQSDLLGGCKTRDTITISNVNTFSTTITTPDDTICLHSSTDLTVTPSPLSEGPFTYLWTPVNGGVISPTSATTQVRPTNTTTYNVAVTSRDGCIINNSRQVVIQGVGPIVSVQPSADYVCPGSNVTLTATVSAVECGAVADPLDPCLPGSTFAIVDAGTGSGTTTGTTAGPTPYRGFWHDGRVQYLYLASELRALGLTAGAITDIAFNISTKASTQPYSGFTVKMGCTSLNELPASFVTSGLTTVVNPHSYTTFAGWNTHTLDLPYNWDGFANLIIEICYDNSSFTSFDHVLFTPTTYNSVLWAQADGSVGCNLTGTINRIQNRPNTRFIMCKAPLTNYTFNWQGSDGTTLPNVSNPTATIGTDVVYTLVVNDADCQGDTSVTVHVDSAVLFSAGPDTVICNSDTIQLNAEFLHPVTPVCTTTYALTSIPYSAILPSGPVTAGPAGDDVVTGALTMPFPFDFFCSPVNTWFISTNGFIAFNAAPGSGCCAGQALPNPAAPNNLVTMIWEDLNTNSGGNIDYFVSGTAPNRVLVVRWRSVAFYGGVGVVNGEIHLYETTNVIEIHTNGSTATGQTSTIGIENATGSAGYSPAGYNASGFTVSTPIAFRFTPQTLGNAFTSIQWTPATGLSNPTVTNPRVFVDNTTTYVIAATFASGCVSYDTITVSLGSFSYSLATPDTICSGDSVQLMFIGDAVSYTWTPDATLSSGNIPNPYASPRVTTTYHISAADSLGCRINDNVVVNVFEPLSPLTLGSDRAICPYDSVILSPSGGPYVSYLWSTGATTSSISTGLQTDTLQDYYLRVSDGHCFFYSDTVTVRKFVLPSATVQPAGDTGICIGDSIRLSAEPGFTSYLWSPGASSGQTITVSTAGTYTYIAIDQNGCLLQASNSANVLLKQPPVADILSDVDSICEGQSTTTLWVNPVNGIVYTWNGQTVSDSFTVTTAGTYTLEANDLGCKNYDAITIGSAEPPVVDLGEDQDVCGCNTEIVLASNISGTYSWSTSETTQSISVSEGGNYSVTVIDNNNCTADDNVNITIRCLIANATVANPESGVIFLGENASLNADVNYTGVFSYLWTPSEYLSDSSVSNPQAIAPQSTITYYVIVTDLENGCVATDSVLLAVAPQADIPMPNAFTPNGDGKNDYYGPVIPQALEGFYKIGEFRIYNRWGQQVHNSNSYWDGKFKGSLQSAGTYMYYITIQGPDRNDPSRTVSTSLSGSFSLIH